MQKNVLFFVFAITLVGVGGCSDATFNSDLVISPSSSEAQKVWRANLVVKKVFVTSTTYRPDFGGLGVADAACQDRAVSAGFGGTWRAWISDNTADAIERVNDVSPWYTPDGSAVLFASKGAIVDSGPAQLINMTELGTLLAPYSLVFSGTSRLGTHISGFDCGGWTSAANSDHWYSGAIVSVLDWNYWGSTSCDTNGHFYCFQQ